MKIKQIIVGLLHTNCYLIVDDKTNIGAIVDPGYNADKIIDVIEKENCDLKYLILTHAHFDHAFEAHIIKEKYNLKLIASKNTPEVISNDNYNQSMNFAKQKLNLPLNEDELLLNDGDEFNIGDLSFKFIYVGGHTIDSSAYYCESEQIVFTGDTLFYDSVGRCDLPGGNENELIDNLENKIITLPGDTKVLPGHGELTTIAREAVYNEYI